MTNTPNLILGASFISAVLHREDQAVISYLKRYPARVLLDSVMPQVLAMANKCAQVYDITPAEMGNRMVRGAELYHDVEAAFQPPS